VFERAELEQKLRLLFQQAKSGNRESYEAFLDLCSVLIRKQLAQLGGKYVSHESREDLLQEILITLHEKKHTYQEDRSLLPWLHAIVRHRFIDHYRSQKRNRETRSLEEMGDIFALSDEPVVYNMEEIMSLLTPKQKEMLLLLKVEGHSYEEAAKSLSMSVSAVKVSMHRLIKTLKGKVTHEE